MSLTLLLEEWYKRVSRSDWKIKLLPVDVLDIVPFATFIALLNVETPATLKLSKFVWPSTSKSAFKSIAPENVETPATLKLSKLVWPSTSISPLISKGLANVETPAIFSAFNPLISVPVSYTHLTLPTNREV